MRSAVSTSDWMSHRATRGWRVLLGIYAGILTAGTHWPRLELGDPAHPPDKMLHFVSFGGLAFLLWQARFFRRHVSLLFFGVAWTVVDEWTQALPGLGRSYSMQDIVASSCGVVATTMVLWAARPQGGPIARLRRSRFDGMLDLLLARPTAWMTFLVACAIGALVGMVVSMFINSFDGDPTPFQAAIVGLVLGAATTGPASLLHGVRTVEERVMRDRLCLGCGEHVSDGDTNCGHCGRAPMVGQWLPVPWISWSDVLRACVPPIVGGLGVIILALVLESVFQYLRPNVVAFATFNTWYRSLAPGMENVITATFLAAVAAVVVDRARARLGRRIENGHRRCIGCGQDLRATPSVQGVGRCGECGAGFVRVDVAT